MREVPDDRPIIVVSVNQELSGDDSSDIREFWESYGMEEELFERIAFIEKP